MLTRLSFVPLTILAFLSQAGATEVLVCYPGGGNVKASQARPTMTRMLSIIESLGGWPSGSFTHKFTTKADECRKLMDQDKPPYVITSTGLFLERRKKDKLQVLVQPVMDGSTDEVYRVLVKKGTASKLEDLKGKTLGGSLLTEREFLHRIVFEGKIDPEKFFHLKPSKRALRALRKLAKGKMDAVLVNQQQFKALKSLPFASDLDVVFESGRLPLVGLAASSARTAAKDRKKMVKALSELCSSEKGKEICEMFGLESFKPLSTQGIYKKVEKLWDKF